MLLRFTLISLAAGVFGGGGPGGLLLPDESSRGGVGDPRGGVAKLGFGGGPRGA